MAPDNPKTVTIYGRLSFANFLYAQSVARNAKSKFVKKPEDVTPDFNLLVQQAQLDKLVTHVTNEFLPYCLQQAANKEKRDPLSKKEVDEIMKIINGQAWDNQPPYIPIKPISDKTAVLAPECVASIKIVGSKGVDIEQRAIVRNEAQLAVPDPAILTYPAIVPLNESVHQMYGGCYVSATLNLYSFISGKHPGFSAAASVAVFREDGDRFGGGVAVDDEEEMFLD